MPRTRLAPSPAIEVPVEDTPFAGVPTRATGNLMLGFGDRAIPCAVFAGTEDGGVKRGEYTKINDEWVKVGRVSAVKNDDGTVRQLVEPSAVEKLVESDRGLIPLTDDEIAAAIGCEGGFAEVECFLPLSVMTMGEYVIDSLYQLRPAPPARGGSRTRRSETTEKAFALVVKAMRLEGVFALVKVAFRGKPRYAAFMPDGRLYTLRYQNEVRLPLPMPDSGTLPDADVMLGRMMVVSKTSNIAPVLRDTASDEIRAYVENKAAETLPEPAPVRQPDRSYEDMIAALRERVTGMGLVTPPVAQPRINDVLRESLRAPRIRPTRPSPEPLLTYEFVATASADTFAPSSSTSWTTVMDDSGVVRPVPAGEIADF